MRNSLIVFIISVLLLFMVGCNSADSGSSSAESPPTIEDSSSAENSQAQDGLGENELPLVPVN